MAAVLSFIPLQFARTNLLSLLVAGVLDPKAWALSQPRLTGPCQPKKLMPTGLAAAATEACSAAAEEATEGTEVTEATEAMEATEVTEATDVVMEATEVARAGRAAVG